MPEHQSGRLQSITPRPLRCRKSLACEKCPQPRKPRWAASTIPIWALGLVQLRTPPDPVVSRAVETRLLLITVDTIRADTKLWEAAGLRDQSGWWTTRAVAAAPA